MGVASLVLGIIGLIVSFIPFCGYFGIPLVIVGLILGIVELVKKPKDGEEKPKKGLGIAGVVLNSLAIIIVIAWTVFFGAAINSNEFQEAFTEALTQAENAR